MNVEKLKSSFATLGSDVDFCSLRYRSQADEVTTVRQDIVEPIQTTVDEGVMVTVFHRGGIGYGATSDISTGGIRQAYEQACLWAKQSAAKAVTNFSEVPRPTGSISSTSKVVRPWSSLTLGDRIDRLKQASRGLKAHPSIVDWRGDLWRAKVDSFFVSTSGANQEQSFDYLTPMLSVVANKGNDTQRRSFGGHAYCRQGGLEVLDELNFWSAGPALVDDVLQLLAAPNCPTGDMDLILDPGQMVLQIHESIGHPLELDRILGDERNYAGTSFVTLDMFGSYQYGSKLLNITHDPFETGEVAGYHFDDDGTAARKEYLIKDGILQRPLGGSISQHRAKLPGVANSRANSWNRPPIDRMANLNLEPGDSSLADMVKDVERGVYMKTNTSWSIDDSRNKFQFGCEWGQLIENGVLTKVVKNPNYRGISANFWRSLARVGNASTLEVMGSPFCGKGEPNQMVFVGHATPPCLFRNVAVFGGE